MLRSVPHYRISTVADLLGVSDDTVRRWVDAGKLTSRTDSGFQVIDGSELAAFARSLVDSGAGPGSGSASGSAPAPGPVPARGSSRGSARNRLAGIVTEVRSDGVMAQVEIAAGRYRLVSLMSREAVDELGLRPGVLATAVIKATMVTVESDSGAQG
jgi:molybdopterin-binding protein